MKLYLCEKPSQAADIAKVLDNSDKPKKAGTHFETAGGIVTWCFGHLLELDAPEDYDPKYKEWNFADLPILPDRFHFSARKDAAGQLRAIGQLLKECASVVVATDADREGEMIGREVLVHHRYSGKVERLWLGALDEENVRKGLAKLRPGEQTVSLYHAALARSEADWLVGMNMSRAVSLKSSAKGGCSIGRVQTPTVALVVRRDLAIENFKARDYYEVDANVAVNGKTIVLHYAPTEAHRIWERAAADAIAQRIAGRDVTLKREATPKREAPPKLFSLSGLQKKANALWGWSADKTLEIAQSLYESHKATTYPRTDCEFLPEEQMTDIPSITRNLLEVDTFSHLRGVKFEARKAVFHTAKITAHHAIIPTKKAPPLEDMGADERKAYMLIAGYYLASLMPDCEYTSTKLSAEAEGTEFSVTGKTPGKPGWRAVFSGATEAQDEEDGEAVETLPDVPNGAKGRIDRGAVVSKRTTPPKRYTEGTLIEDMKSVAKFVTDPEKKARLKETSGIGTEATRASIIKRIKTAGYVETKGKQIISTPKARDLVAMLDRELPALADPAETARWEDGLEAVAEGKQGTDAFVAQIGGLIREYLGVLGAKPDARPAGGAGGSAGKPTGVMIGGSEIMDCGEYYTCQGAFPGRIYANFYAHRLTPQEIEALVAQKRVLDLQDCKTKEGSPTGPKKVWYNPNRKPYPGVEVHVATESTGVQTEVRRGGKGGAISLARLGDKEYYTVEGYVSGGYPVKFWAKNYNRTITPDELAAILAAGDKGILVEGFSTNSGEKFAKYVRYNPKKKPYAGLEFSD